MIIGYSRKFSSGFSPTDIAGLYAWHDANAITGKSDGNALSQWDDSSGNARHLVQATGVNQPLYKTAIQNGLPIVRFDGSNDTIESVFGGTLAQPMTMFLVMKKRTAVSSQILFMDGNSSYSASLFSNSGGPNTIYFFNGSGQPNKAITFTNFNVIVVVNKTGSNAAKMAVNGGAYGTDTVSTVSITGFTLGSNGSGSENADIDVAEAIIYDSELNQTNIDSVESYLGTKWNITVA